MKVSGIVVYEDLEGGFWGIVSEDGSRYELEDGLPKEFAQAGIEVEAMLEPTGGVSFRQWGTPVKVVNVKRPG